MREAFVSNGLAGRLFRRWCASGDAQAAVDRQALRPIWDATLAEVFAATQGGAEDICDQLLSGMLPTPPEDDVAVLVLRPRPAIDLTRH